ncbi:MAG: transglutaminase family protein [Deltaproteobacteria bacterium]|nr:transglutaminase family protein [Deltaproteobacteria bacterium]
MPEDFFQRRVYPVGRGVFIDVAQHHGRGRDYRRGIGDALSLGEKLDDVFPGRRGVCQDFSHLMISCLSSTGLAARYVSGYLLTRPAPGKPRRVGADASHAWVSLFVPGMGWIDFDPTNSLMPSLEHITIGWGRDFADVTPLRGVINGGGEQTLEVKVTVEPS